MSFYGKYLKRPQDFVLALAALVLLSPVMVSVWVLVRMKLGSPVLFCQKRPGLREKFFRLYKFRSMTDEKDINGNLLPDEKRLTKFGAWLRSTSLDELPELFNILKGDMSFVGPRPLLVDYIPWYTEEEHHRHDVRPGLTGWAQVNGRNLLAWDDRLKFDLEYVHNLSFIFDVKILLLTVKRVFDKTGVLEDTSKGEPNFAEERRLKNSRK